MSITVANHNPPTPPPLRLIEVTDDADAKRSILFEPYTKRPEKIPVMAIQAVSSGAYAVYVTASVQDIEILATTLLSWVKANK